MLGFPAVLIRTSTERPEAVDNGSIIVGGVKQKDVEQAVELAVSMAKNGEKNSMPFDYRDDNVSSKVVKVIQSYTSIVNITTWNKK